METCFTFHQPLGIRPLTPVNGGYLLINNFPLAASLHEYAGCNNSMSPGYPLEWVGRDRWPGIEEGSLDRARGGRTRHGESWNAGHLRLVLVDVQSSNVLCCARKLIVHTATQ